MLLQWYPRNKKGWFVNAKERLELKQSWMTWYQFLGSVTMWLFWGLFAELLQRGLKIYDCLNVPESRKKLYHQINKDISC